MSRLVLRQPGKQARVWGFLLQVVANTGGF